MMQATLIYLAAVNVAGFGLMAADKGRALRDMRRIPEQALLGWAAVGGALGAVAAQHLFRHKTAKEPFRTRLVAICSAWTALLAVLFILALRASMLETLGA